MAFRFTSIGPKVKSKSREDRVAAASALSNLFAKHRTCTAVAKALGVSAKTVGRWRAALKTEGLLRGLVGSA